MGGHGAWLPPLAGGAVREARAISYFSTARQHGGRAACGATCPPLFFHFFCFSRGDFFFQFLLEIAFRAVINKATAI